MPQSKYKVVMTGPVYSRMMKLLYGAYPKEGFAFLCGEILDPFSYYISKLHIPEQRRVTKSSFHFTTLDLVTAQAAAARKSLRMLGICHSHTIHKELNHYCTALSSLDAEFQVNEHITLSLVVAIFPDHSSVLNCWLDGYPAPLDVFKKSGRKQILIDVDLQPKLTN